MARMPQADWQGEHSPQNRMDRYDIVCIHTIVGFAPAHAAHFSTTGSGKIIQSRDTAFQSAANLHGNHRIIAIENEDHGPAFGGTPRLPNWVPLTDAQITACAEILAWAHRVHGVPLQLCPDSRPGSRGLAYHRQGIDGNYGPGTDYPNRGRVSGGEVWSSSPGKVCPTDIRIDQLPLILERAKQIDNPEDDMAQYEDLLNEIKRVGDQTLKELRAFRRGKTESDAKVKDFLRKIVAQNVDDATKVQARTILAEIEQVEAALAAHDTEEEV